MSINKDGIDAARAIFALRLWKYRLMQIGETTYRRVNGSAETAPVAAFHPHRSITAISKENTPAGRGNQRRSAALSTLNRKPPSKDGNPYASIAMLQTPWEHADFGNVLIGQDPTAMPLSHQEINNTRAGFAAAQRYAASLLHRIDYGGDASIVAAASRFFGTSPYGLHNAEIAQIRNAVAGLSAGLSSRPKINLAPSYKVRAEGMVPIHVDPYGTTTYGDVHLSTEKVRADPHDIPRLILHEVSHKFAHTRDFDQFHWNNYYAGGGLRYQGGGVPPGYQLQNADSLAAFTLFA